jgi:hypothetical protein
MGIASLARARLTREDACKGAGLIAGFVAGGASSQALECGLNGGEVVERIEAVGATAKFAWSLGTAEHEEAEDGGLVAAKIEHGANPMLVLGNASVADRSDKSEALKKMEGLANLFFRQIEDRVAAGALVARVKQGVEGEGIVLWRGDLFLDERAENAELVGRKLHGYKVATGEGAVGREIMKNIYANGQIVISQ